MRIFVRSGLVAFVLAFGVIAAATLALLAQTPAPASPPQSSAAVASRENAYRANNVGVARLEQYDFPAATAAFRRALEIDPALSIARLNLGIALFYGGDQEGARKELESVRSALPDRPQVEYVLGLIARSADRVDDAVESFTRVRKLDPTDVGAAINLGQLLVQTRRFDEAIKLLRPAAEADEPAAVDTPARRPLGSLFEPDQPNATTAVALPTPAGNPQLVSASATHRRRPRGWS